jgi:hypothetical protein
MNTNAMLAIFAIATLALIVPLTMNIQPAYSQTTHCRETSFEGDPSFSEARRCFTPPNSSDSLGRNHEFCSEAQDLRINHFTHECSVQPDDNARQR